MTATGAGALTTLPLGAAGLVLLAAAFHAGWNALVKVGGDRLVTLAVINGVAALVCLPVLFFVSLPAAQSWPYLLSSVVIHVGYYVVLVQAYRVGDLGHVYPLARGASPLLVAIGAAVFAGEWLGGMAFAGVALASIGIASLAFESGRPWRGDPRPLLYALAVAAFIVSYTLVDGTGVRLSGNPLAYIAWLFVLDGAPVAVVVALTRRGELGARLGRDWKKGCAGGVLQLGAYGLVIWAMTVGPMAQVSALRETGVVFAALIGTWMLKERFGRRRIIAAAVVASGIVVMKVGSS